jgi:exodeoxyribonuclease VII large subunit
MARSLMRGMEQRMQEVDYLGRRLVHPGGRIRSQEQQLAHLGVRVGRAASHGLVQARLHLTAIRHRLAAAAPDLDGVHTRHRRFAQRLTGAMQQLLERQRAGLGRLDAHLNALSPQHVLERGYSIVSHLDGDIVRDSAQLAPGEDVTMTFARGAARARVSGTSS